MADITADFNELLVQKGSQTAEPKPYDLQRINAFLQEAHSINARITDLNRELRAIRPAYLSTAPSQRRRQASTTTTATTTTTASRNASERTRPLTDAERDAIDAQSKTLLRQLNGAITSLQQAEDVRKQTADSVALSARARAGFGSALGRWAAGGAVTTPSIAEDEATAARNTLAAHRDSVILYLQARLERVSRWQSEMMDARLSRELEKSKSILAKSAAPASGGQRDRRSGVEQYPAPVDGDWSAEGGGDAAAGAGATLTPAQQQAFAEENDALLKHYATQLDQVRAAERSILEISELHSTLHANLQQQSEHIDQLVQDSYFTTENLGKGNKELKKASERRSTAQAVFYSTVAFCSFLVVWDLVF